MPNTGRPSPACYLCRKRRVKCDLNPTGCLRCAKIGKDCSGYREVQDLLFHNQSKESFAPDSVSVRQKEERDLTLQVREEDKKSSACSTGVIVLSLDHAVVGGMARVTFNAGETTLTLPPQIADHWGAYCIPIILHQFSAPSDRGRFYGYLDFLPELYSESKEGSCLSSVTSVVAKAYITNMSRTTPNREEVVQVYGRALSLTNAALQDPEERVKDSTIIAVWLLGIYEILVSSPKKSFIAPPEAYHMHSEGLVSLIQIRGPGQFCTRRGRNLFWMMYLFIQIHCLIANINGPSQSRDWFELLQPQISEDDRLAFVVSKYMYRISLLCPRILYHIRHSHMDHRRLESQSTSLLTEIDALHEDIQSWNAEFLFQPTDLASLHLCNALRASHIKLQYFTILLLSHLISRSDGAPISPCPIFRKQRCVEVIQRLSSEVLQSIPLVLGDSLTPPERKMGCWADALRLMWPLIVVARVPAALHNQRRESQQALQRIGKQMGIALALDCEPPQARYPSERILRER